MSVNLDIQLNGAKYPVACSEAEAPRVKQLAEQLQTRLSALHKDLGYAQVTDAHLLALMALMLMDEVSEKSNASAASVPVPSANAEEQELFIHAVSHLTERVNLIAQKLRAA